MSAAEDAERSALHLVAMQERAPGELDDLAAQLLAKYAHLPEPPAAGEAAPAPITAAERLARLLTLGIPKRPARVVAGLEGRLEHTPVLLGARGFLSEPAETTLVLAGGKGVGKTVAAAWLASREPTEPYSPTRQDWPVALRGIFLHAHRLSSLSRTDHELRSQLERAWLVAIDDLGVEYLDERGWVLSLIDGLLVHRHDNARRTVITTNLTLERFRARYGERITDRLREGAYVECKDASLRGRP